MIGRTILIADDDPEFPAQVEVFLKRDNFDPVSVQSGQDALKAIESRNFPVVITDLNMPGLSGRELLQRLQALEDAPVILVLTADDSMESVTAVMREGAYNYLTKPIRAADFTLKVERAWEYSRLRRIENEVRRNNQARIERQLGVHSMVSELISKKSADTSSDIFHNLRTSMSQGSGFGGMLSLIGLIASTARNEDGKYIVPATLMEAVFENAKTAGTAVSTLQYLEDLGKKIMEPAILTGDGVRNILEKTVSEVKEFANLKNQNLHLSSHSINRSRHYRLESEHFQRALRELLVNAMQFSRAGNDIFVLEYSTPGWLHLAVLSQPDLDHELTQSERNLIFEPFYRMGNTVDERYGTLDYGLGLTVVNKIILRERGRVTTGYVDYHMPDATGKVRCLNFEIEIPEYRLAAGESHA